MSVRASRAWLLALSAVLAIGFGPPPPVATSGRAGETDFAPKIGVCTSVGNAAMAKAAGCDYVEEGVRSFLVPDRPDAEFLEKLEALERSPLPVPACNSFLPESLKSVGTGARHDEIIAFAGTAFRRAREAGV